MTKGEQLVERFGILTAIYAYYMDRRICQPEKYELHPEEDEKAHAQAVMDKHAAKAELLAYLKQLESNN